MSINMVMVSGNVGRDAEVRFATSGNAVANFSMVTDWGYGDKKESEWHDIVCFGKQAEFAGERVKKGMGITVIGRIQTRSWKDNATGESKYRTSIIANTLDVTRWPNLQEPLQAGQQAQPFNPAQVPETPTQAVAQPMRPAQQPLVQAATQSQGMDDDIPF